MKLASAVLTAAMLCAGCASVSPEPAKVPVKSLLEQADARMADADYGGASALYAQFATAEPGNAQAARARETGVAIDRMLVLQAELERMKQDQELPRLRRELADRRGEADRLKAEVAKLRADLERLRNIDLQNPTGVRK